METPQDVILNIAVGVLIVALLWAAYQIIRFYRTEHFACPRCGYCWKPPLLKMVFSTNAAEGKIIRCPQCGVKEYMEPVKDKR